MKSLPYIVFFLLFLFSIPSSRSQNIRRIDNTKITTTALEERLQLLHKEANVHGLMVAIVTKDSIIFQNTYGSRNLKEKKPLLSTHNFYGASLSKPLFAYIVLKLVDKGLLDLDKPLVSYLEKPLPSYTFEHSYEGYQDLKDTEQYKKITARMCLSHTSGFPNWRYLGTYGINMNRKLEIEFQPGTYYSYSGEGIQLLQRVVEEVTKKGLEEIAQEYVFQPFDMSMTSFVWQDRFDTNFAVGHYKKKKTVTKVKRDQEYAAGSMETTPEDYTKFIQAMLKREGLTKNIFEQMISPQIEIVSTQQFGKNRWKKTDANKDIALSYGLGWGLYKTPHGKVVFKEGHSKGWEHYVALYPDNDLGIIIMTNSSNGESIFKELVEIAMGDRWLPWYWEGYFPYNFKKLPRN